MLPFGPKLEDFPGKVADHGLLDYHVRVYKRALECKETFKALYKDSMKCFRMEDLQTDPNACQDLFRFCEIEVDAPTRKRIFNSLDKERAARATVSGPWDDKIREALSRHKCD